MCTIVRRSCEPTRNEELLSRACRFARLSSVRLRSQYTVPVVSTVPIWYLQYNVPNPLHEAILRFLVGARAECSPQLKESRPERERKGGSALSRLRAAHRERHTDHRHRRSEERRPSSPRCEKRSQQQASEPHAGTADSRQPGPSKLTAVTGDKKQAQETSTLVTADWRLHTRARPRADVDRS